jgi:coronin-1B/1C/6
VEESPYLHVLSEFKTSDPQRGLAVLPKRACNVAECEVARIYKVHPDRVEPISFKVPRKSDQFQSDIFPSTVSDTAALTADEWFAGKNAKPKLVSLENGFQPSARKEFVSEAPPAADISDIIKLPGNEKEVCVLLTSII